MALISKSQINKVSGTINRMTNVGGADYFVAEYDGTKYFRIRTYATTDAKTSGPKQVLDFDKESAKALIDALKKAFEL